MKFASLNSYKDKNNKDNNNGNELVETQPILDNKLKESPPSLRFSSQQPNFRITAKSKMLISGRIGNLDIHNCYEDEFGNRSYHCTCLSCNEDVYIKESDMKTGEQIDCGCGWEENLKLKRENPKKYDILYGGIKRRVAILKHAEFIGQRFGKLVVKSPCKAPTYRGKDLHWKYRCKCDCGDEVDIYKHHLKAGKSKSCGCGKARYKIEPLTRYNDLIVLEDDGTRSKQREILWKCKCDCGKITHVRGRDLANSRVVSCGCRKYRVGLKASKVKIVKQFEQPWVEGI